MPEGISRRGDAWRARYRNPETGRQHERPFDRQVDAVRWRRPQLGALDRGRWVDPEAGKVSILAYFEAWGAHLSPTAEDRVRDAAAHLFDEVVGPGEGTVRAERA